MFESIKKRINRAMKAWNEGETISFSSVIEMFSGSYNAELGEDLAEITYFTCLKTLSESLGKMPCYLMDKDKRRVIGHDTGYFLNTSPNNYMTPLQLFTFLEYCRNHYGNGYCFIARLANGKIRGLYPLDPRAVQVWIDNTADEITARRYFYRYTDTVNGQMYWLNPEDVLHVKSWVTEKNGLVGKSVREILAAAFAGAKASSRFLSDLYQKGLTANAVVKYLGDLNKAEQGQLLDRIEEQARENGRRLITLPVGFDIQKLDLSLTDAQFAELKKYSALQIAGAFGVEPIYLNDYSKASYANSSMQSLSFYINTLLYNITYYEQEMNRKMLTRAEIDAGKGFKFNVAVILRGDPTQQADVLQKMVQSGIYSINDALSLLDKPPCENGDVHVINGSYVKLEDIGAAYY